MIFEDRKDAAFRLADRLLPQPDIVQSDCERLLILSIPRGGVIIGDIIARALGCAHDVLIVKKIGFPGHEELAMGAVAEDGTVLLDREMIAWYDLAPDEVHAAIANARIKVARYMRLFRRGKTLDVTGKTVLVVDDGVATGETLKAGIRWLRGESHRARKVIVAVPVCSPVTLAELEALADETICLYVPEDFMAVGQYYRKFEPISNEEVLTILYRQGNPTPIDKAWR
jgi:predicted phosphoribosyltransferase